MDELGAAEFRALRATIRERGTVRPILAVATLGAWAALSVWMWTAAPGLPAAMLPALILIYAGFEAVAALHLGVERIGRYLQTDYEHPGRPPRWETLAMAFGRATGSVSVDPLFTVPFLAALVVNLVPVAGATPLELAAIAAAHALVAVRILRVRHYARQQRQTDLARFRELVSPTRPHVATSDAPPPDDRHL